MALSRRDALILAGIGVAAATAGAIVGPRMLQSRAGAAALRAARFTGLDGRVRGIDEWRGKVLVCNFWATWCPPCREEIPLLVSERNAFASKGLEVVGIAVDSAAKVAEFAKTIKISYPILVADASGIKLMRELGNRSGALPYTVFLDRDGTIVGRKLGALHRPELERILHDLLGT
jgi:thiol-disulfide isomerase/thioredoxin